MKNKRGRISFLLTVTAVGWFWSRPLYSREVVTEETLSGMFGRTESESLKKNVQGHLEAVLRGFMIGDLTSIERSAGELARNMGEYAGVFKPQMESKTNQVPAAVAQIIEEADQLKMKAAKGDYKEAFQRFSALVNQCIQCHQTERSWGWFPENVYERVELPRKEQARLTKEVVSDGAASEGGKVHRAAEEEPDPFEPGFVRIKKTIKD